MNYSNRKFVDLHVIDAIDEAAFNSGGSDASMLSEALKDTSINIVPHIARDIDSLKATVARITSYRASYLDPRKAIPYVHISCHGLKDSLVLGDGEKLPWSTLSNALLPLQEKTDYNVPLSISSCWGYHGSSLAYVIDAKYKKRRPFYSLIGPIKDEQIGLLCDAFAHFYRNLLVSFKSMKRSVYLTNKFNAAKLDYTYGSAITY